MSSRSSVPSSADGRSAVSSNNKEIVKIKFGERCIVCGYPNVVDVAHIFPKSTRGQPLADSIKRWSRDLDRFERNLPENLLALCPNHHREYDSGLITLVPTPAARRHMILYEQADFQSRLDHFAQHQEDPGRKLLFPASPEAVIDRPKLTPGFEYVPLTTKSYVEYVNGTAERKHWFHSRGGKHPRDISSLNVPIYPLLYMAYQSMLDPATCVTQRARDVRKEVMHLVGLYQRRLESYIFANGKIPLADRIKAGEAEWSPAYQPGNAQGAMATIPEHHDGGAAEHDATMLDDAGPCSSLQTPSDGGDGIMSTRVVLADGRDDDDGEVVVTPAVLSSRVHWRPIKSANADFSSMRFATSSDFITFPDATATEGC